jgi:preprotein translocase subunit SecG
MHSNSVLWILGVVAVIAFIVVLLIQSFKRKLISTVSKSEGSPSLFSDNSVGRNLSTLIIALSNSKESSGVLLEKLKSNSQECAEEFAEAFSKLSETEYNAKWLLAYGASQFESPEFIPLLNGIAKSEIPGEKSKDIHLFSTVAEETAIRFTAVEGIKSIAQKNHRQAEADLFDLLRSKYITLNIAACQGLIEINKENKAAILEILPREKQFIIDIMRKDVREIPFIKNPEPTIPSSKTYLSKPKKGDSNIQQVSSKRGRGRSKPPQIHQ